MVFAIWEGKCLLGCGREIIWADRPLFLLFSVLLGPSEWSFIGHQITMMLLAAPAGSTGRLRKLRRLNVSRAAFSLLQLAVFQEFRLVLSPNERKIEEDVCHG